uniref:Uncharacterized protein n=1 Tax=Anguilla anguilla TaxID=7936 RepID=A0A0E9TCU4_ANGAN
MNQKEIQRGGTGYLTPADSRPSHMTKRLPAW